MKISTIVIFLLVVFSACHKDEKLTTDPGAKLEFSEDTVFFDTIFTSAASITKRLLVYNRNEKAVAISSIELGGKASSQYDITINGQQTWFKENVTLRGKDSLYVLVKVNINPQNQSEPFLVKDSILFNTNGNLQQVPLLAYGQDATFLNSVTLPCDTVWTAQKPFVVLDFIRVAPGCTLTIKKGVKIYFHDEAQLRVEGTLLVEGDKDSAVVFSGDKFGPQYEKLSGQWDGIVLEAVSKGNSFDYAIIENATTGISIEHDPSDADTIAEVTLSHSIIRNMKKSGVEANGTDVFAWNSLFINCVRPCFAGLGGGNYHFRHCTFASYSFGFFRESSALEISNYTVSSSGIIASPLKSRMLNCILWGDRANELVLNDEGSNPFDFAAHHSILKTTRTDQNVNSNQVNVNPLFESPVLSDFHLQTGSPAINAGMPTLITTDLDGKTRDANPDGGAYEK